MHPCPKQQQVTAAPQPRSTQPHLRQGLATLPCPQVPDFEHHVVGAADDLVIVHLQAADRVAVANHGHLACNAGPAILSGQVPHLLQQQLPWQRWRCGYRYGICTAWPVYVAWGALDVPLSFKEKIINIFYWFHIPVNGNTAGKTWQHQKDTMIPLTMSNKYHCDKFDFTLCVSVGVCTGGGWGRGEGVMVEAGIKVPSSSFEMVKPKIPPNSNTAWDNEVTRSPSLWN